MTKTPELLKTTKLGNVIAESLQQKIDAKTKPVGSLGKLEQIALQIGLIQNTLSPKLTKPTHLVFAADHGITESGVSAYPQEVTYQMVLNFLSGGAAINVFCRQHNIDLKIIDAGVNCDFDVWSHSNLVPAKIAKGTKNIVNEQAMSMEQCLQAMNKGRELVQNEHQLGCNIISFGEMGIGNTSIATLLLHQFTGKSIEDCTGRGASLEDAGLQNKIKILQSCANKYKAVSPIEILAAYGGLELAMICGAILEAKQCNMVILIDGFVILSAVLAAYEMDSSVIEYCIFCHCPDKTANDNTSQSILDYLGVEGLINLNMRLGEGTIAAVAHPIVQSSVLFLNEMASFDDASVSRAVHKPIKR